MHPAPPVAPPDETITLRVPKWKVLLVVLGLLVGAALAGGVVWWLVHKGPATQTTAEKKLVPPAGTSAEEAAREYYQKSKTAQDVDEKIALIHQSHRVEP